MKKSAKKLLCAVLCAVMAFTLALPAFADAHTAPEPTWQNTIDTVTPVGDGPAVKLKLWYDGYKITECKLPPQYDIVFKDGTKTSVRIPDEPSHFAPGAVYENYFDVDTPEGRITLYAKVMLRDVDSSETYFSVGQYILQGSLGEDGVPVAGSTVFEYPIFNEPCEAEVEKAGFFVKVVFFFYSLYLKAERWFRTRFGR